MGPAQTVGYLAYDHTGGRAAMIDAPLGVTRKCLQFIKDSDLTLDYIINTHGHWEQTAENTALASATDAKLLAHSWDAARLADPKITMEAYVTAKIAPSRADRSLQDAEHIIVGEFTLEVFHTPGHSPGSVCLYCPSDSVLFSGDTLLRTKVGSTDAPGGSSERLVESLRRLANLPDATRVYPARGLPTTIGNERWLLDLAAADAK
ncbi:MAG TPA: MBL fold metallo-hydrolase [Chloroflexia bacterium]|nr:MBL fold metallo-hydrolase [Chloroflexia bacterium]